MNTDLAVREAPMAVQLSPDQLQYIAGTEFVPPGMRGNLPAILACVATGRELGIGDMVALKSIHIIDGKASFSAELMVQLVRNRGHSLTGEVTADKAVVRGKRADNGDTMEVTWTLKMAERAGLLSKQNWKRYPEAMLWARAASQLCRMLFADCFAGATYTPEEMGDEHTTSAGEPNERVHAPAVEPPPTRAPVPQADATHVEPASPAVDLNDPEIPFGDAPAPQLQPPATTAQKKKLNVLIGKLRPDHISTLQLWQSMGRDPVMSDDGVLHWSPLRDSLTKREASELIERLQRFADDKADGSYDFAGRAAEAQRARDEMTA